MKFYMQQIEISCLYIGKKKVRKPTANIYNRLNPVDSQYLCLGDIPLWHLNHQLGDFQSMLRHFIEEGIKRRDNYLKKK